MEIAIIILIFLGIMLCIWYLSMRASSKEKSRSIEGIKKSGEDGDVVAQFRLAGMFFEGNGVPQDDKEAVKWYEKAAAHGHVEAQFILGTLYEKGDGVKGDNMLAYKWFSKAADQGHNRAMIMLESDKWKNIRTDDLLKDSKDMVQSHDDHVPPTGEDVQRYIEKAKDGDIDAQYNLGVIYYHGEGVDRDYDEALSWFHMAAEQDDPDAQYNLGFMYGRGEGIEKDRNLSMQWFNRAAGQGHVGATEILQKMLRKQSD